MNLQQVKQDVANGAIISKATWLKVLEAALMMKDAMNDMALADGSGENASSAEILAARIRSSANYTIDVVEAL